MDDIMHEKLNISPTLNFNEKRNRQSLNKKFSTHINKFMISVPWKDTQCIIPVNEVITGKFLCVGGEKISTFPK